MRSKGIEHLLGECVWERSPPNQTEFTRNYACSTQVSRGEGVLDSHRRMLRKFRDCILSRSH